MSDLVRIWEEPMEEEIYIIAGWEQWADAGELSSGLPRYLIDELDARKIGEIHPDSFYLFQVPGTHHLLRPEIRLSEGYCEELAGHRNELYYAQVNGKALLIFVGEEPHQHADSYGEAFFDMVQAVNAKRVISVAGVYGAMPYDKEREISCAYSLRSLKRELERYAVRFSNYEGGTTIDTFLAHKAESRGLEYIVFYGFAPAYEFTQLGLTLQAMRVEEDWKAWHDIMRRVNHMLGLDLDLSDLEERSYELVKAWERRIDELEEQHPELNVRAYMEKLARDFDEQPFIPLDDAWDELGDLL